MIVLDLLPYVNLGLSLGACIALSILAVQFYKRRRFFLQQFHALAEEMKRDLPPVIVGEILTRWDMVGYEKRLSDLETRADWLEQRNSEPEE